MRANVLFSMTSIVAGLFDSDGAKVTSIVDEIVASLAARISITIVTRIVTRIVAVIVDIELNRRG